MAESCAQRGDRDAASRAPLPSPELYASCSNEARSQVQTAPSEVAGAWLLLLTAEWPWASSCPSWSQLAHRQAWGRPSDARGSPGFLRRRTGCAVAFDISPSSPQEGRSLQRPMECVYIPKPSGTCFLEPSHPPSIPRALGPPSSKEGEGTVLGDPELPSNQPGVYLDQETLFFSLIHSAFNSGR